MDHKAEDFSPEDSLRLIQDMIDKTKTSVVDNSFFFLLWGWLAFTGAVLQFILKVIVRTEAHPAAWNIMLLGLILSNFHKAREKGPRMRTYVDEGLKNIWTCLGVIQVLIVFIFMRRGGWENCYTIFTMVYSIGCFLTGRLLKFPPLVRGAVACWCIVILSTFASPDANILLMAAALLISYIIPGYLLRKEYIKTITKASLKDGSE